MRVVIVGLLVQVEIGLFGHDGLVQSLLLAWNARRDQVGRLVHLLVRVRVGVIVVGRGQLDGQVHVVVLVEVVHLAVRPQSGGLVELMRCVHVLVGGLVALVQVVHGRRSVQSVHDHFGRRRIGALVVEAAAPLLILFVLSSCFVTVALEFNVAIVPLLA